MVLQVAFHGTQTKTACELKLVVCVSKQNYFMRNLFPTLCLFPTVRANVVIVICIGATSFSTGVFVFISIQFRVTTTAFDVVAMAYQASLMPLHFFPCNSNIGEPYLGRTATGSNQKTFSKQNGILVMYVAKLPPER